MRQNSLMVQASALIERLLLDLMRTPERVDGRMLIGLAQDEWDTLLALAERHRCAPYLAYVFARRTGLALPDRLQAIRARSARRNLAVARDCIRIHAVLAGANIEHRFLKGVPLAFRDYPHGWMRPMRDIDVLVESSRLAEAYDLLLAAGGSIPAYADMPTEPLPEGKHLPPIRSPGGAMAVEVHYRLLLPTITLSSSALEAFEGEVWARKDSVTVGASNLPVPAPEALLGHLVVHGLLDHELNNGPLFLTDLIHLLRSGRIDRTRWRDVVSRGELARAVQVTAAMMPPAEAENLLAGLPAVTPLPDTTLLALMLQPANQRNQVKLRASFVDGPPSSRVKLAWQKLIPRRAVLAARWRAETRRPDHPPRLALLWLWYVGRKLVQYLRTPSGTDKRTLDELRALRHALRDHAPDG